MGGKLAMGGKVGTERWKGRMQRGKKAGVKREQFPASKYES